MIIKYIILALIVILTVYLIIDTTVWVVRKVKEKRKKRLEEKNKTE